MSTESAYLSTSKQFPVGQFESVVISTLNKLKIIDGFYDESLKQFASSGKMEFEYASIHDSDKFKLIPEASSEGYGATCANCQADMDNELYEVLNICYDFESDTGEEKDMRELEIECPKCKTSVTLVKLKFLYPTKLSNQYFQFVDIEDEVPASIVTELEKELNCPIDILYEHM